MKKRVAVLVAVSLLCLLLLSPASASSPNWDVSGIWTGNSGLTGNMVYHFVMDLSQVSGDVSGTIHYTNASPVGTITGHVDGNDFYFTRNDTNQNYSATCWPCTISADGTYFHGFGTGPGQNVEWEAWGQAARIVMIDIKPGSDPNSINLKSKGVVPVAVLTTDDFDASTVDPVTVVFAGASPLRWTMEDVDGDGDMDLLFHFKTQELNLTETSTEATLTGSTFGGQPIEGTDTVNIVPPAN
jgi:hypothetical protein